jgi:tetratricopeptide (TPR) repeat protein
VKPAVLRLLSLCLLATPVTLHAQASTAEILSGQELIYRGRFGAAQIYFADLAQAYPGDAAGPTLQASALIWWAEARGDEAFEVDSVDALLSDAIARAQLAADSASDDAARAAALFWLGSAYGYRARQAELRGSMWRAGRDARSMRDALNSAYGLDSTRLDCLLGLGVYDYALARASALGRLVARIIGLGSGDAQRALGWMRRASEDGVLTRTEARWVYASALLREGERGDAASREEAIRRISELAEQFPDNPVFRRALIPGGNAP